MKLFTLPTTICFVSLLTASNIGFAQSTAAPLPACETPPVASCNAEGCPAGYFSNLGNTTEAITGRQFFLDYPCDLKPNEKVNFILSIHGGGSIANWQRHYFPALDYKDKYRLVIATGTAETSEPVRMWTGEADDEYLQNIVNYVVEKFGRDNINSFWLAGHSQGGMTSNRIVCTDFFKDKVDGWLSLSGGRIGPIEIPEDFFGPNGRPPNLSAAAGGTGAAPGRAATPSCDISYIFTTGELEMVELPDTSPWAEKYNCDARTRKDDIVDTQKGYVTGERQGRPASWGRAARPGTATEYVYPNCDGNKLVADVVRLDKGHTEGLEPKVTERLIELMLAAPGGKLNQ